MNQVKHLGITLGLTVLLFLIYSQPAYASIDAGTFDGTARAYYIDPGTGSIIIQVLVGSFVAGLAMIGVYRMRVKNFFTSLFSRHKQDNDDDESKESGESA
ncbi:MAG: hypothetical protein R6U93_08250 [Dehalococcoidia bacterium]